MAPSLAVGKTAATAALRLPEMAAQSRSLSAVLFKVSICLATFSCACVNFRQPAASKQLPFPIYPLLCNMGQHRRLAQLAPNTVSTKAISLTGGLLLCSGNTEIALLLG